MVISQSVRFGGLDLSHSLVLYLFTVLFLDLFSLADYLPECKIRRLRFDCYSLVPIYNLILDLFFLVISQSVRFGGWDLIGQGLVDLSFMLLHVQPAFGKMNSKTRSLHNLASAILAKVSFLYCMNKGQPY